MKPRGLHLILSSTSLTLWIGGDRSPRLGEFPLNLIKIQLLYYADSYMVADSTIRPPSDSPTPHHEVISILTRL